MLFEMLLHGLAVIQLLPPGTVSNDDRHSQEKAVPVVAVASEEIAESAESIQPPTTPPHAHDRGVVNCVEQPLSLCAPTG